MVCRKCKSETVPEYDYVNRVRVVVCSDPTCLYREYPDYPRRKGNEEVCYICGRLFTFGEKEIGVICQECKKHAMKNKRWWQGETRRDSVQLRIM